MSAFLKLHFVGKWILLSISSQPPKIRVKPGHTYKSIQFDSRHREGEIGREKKGGGGGGGGGGGDLEIYIQTHTFCFEMICKIAYRQE